MRDKEYLDSLGLFYIPYTSEDYRAPMMAQEYTEIDLSERNDSLIVPILPGNVAGIFSLFEEVYIESHYRPRGLNQQCYIFWPHSLCVRNLVVDYNNPYEIAISKAGMSDDDTYLIVLSREGPDICGGPMDWDYMSPTYIIVHEKSMYKAAHSAQIKDSFRAYLDNRYKGGC